MSSDSLTLARKIAAIAIDGLAEDAVILGMADVASFCDHFVICQGRSSLHLGAIYDDIVHKLKDDGIQAAHREGGRNSPWIVLDYGGVVVHVFDAPAREFYDLEGLWAEAERMELSDDAGEE